MTDIVVSYIDHSVLKPTETLADVRRGCELCARLGVASICVKPCDVALAADLLSESDVAVSTVIGFPHGNVATESKVAEAHLACQNGAAELDMVSNVSRVLDEDWAYVEDDIASVVAAGREHGAITKVIFETGLLPNDDLKIRLCEICERAAAAFVKTSTGFGYRKLDDGHQIPTGATEHDIRLMRKHCSDAVGVKAAGGMRSYADAKKLVDLGATRLGTSSTETIAAGAPAS